MPVSEELYNAMRLVDREAIVGHIAAHLDYADDVEVSDYLSGRWHDLYQDLSQGALELNGKLIVHRCIDVDNPKQFANAIKKGKLPLGPHHGLGIYWTWALEAAKCYEGGTGQWPVIVSSLVDLDAIDVHQTTLANMMPGTGETELEITLKAGATVWVFRVDYDRGKPPLEFKPPISMKA